MAGFFSKLFGLSGGSAQKETSGKEATEAYGDLMIRARPMREGAQYRLAGSIEKQTETGLLIRSFIRADLFTSEEDATAATLRKARQIIDQTGPSLFSDGAVSRMV